MNEGVNHLTGCQPIRFQRVWAMPSADTFDCEPIKGFVQKYLLKSKVSVDPFARNKRWATYTNDLNPNTAAEYHMDAEEFLHRLASDGVSADLIIIDPPYSPRQISECYQGIGKKVTMRDTQNSALYSRVRRAAAKILSPNATVLHFGWNSHGMINNGGYGWEIIEILLVCHGSAHNDTICMAEKKIASQPDLFSVNQPNVSGDNSSIDIFGKCDKV